MKKDIFISYHNDGEGNNFAARLKEDLSRQNYLVYFNSHEQGSGCFPERLQKAVSECCDFILVLSEGCMRQLIEHNEIDWVREELLLAHSLKKNIIPVLIGKVIMPRDKRDMPEDLQFLPDLDAVYLPEQYLTAPFASLLLRFHSYPAYQNIYRDSANGNFDFDVCQLMINTKEKAKNGDVEAMFQLGYLYYYGIATTDSPHCHINYSEAARCFRLVAESDHELAPKAKYILGGMYYSGIVPGEEQSFSHAMELYQAAEEDIPGLCQEKMVFMLSNGVGTKFDMQRIITYFEQYGGANTGKNSMAKFYINYGMYQDAIEVLESVDGIYPDAEYKLGQLYLRGLHESPPRPDVYRAEHHFRKAAENNHLDATHALGLMNFRGQFGFPQNLYRAREYYKIAAEKGHRGAQYDYAWMCKYGLGGEKDIGTAIKYFECSAEKAHSLSAMELAVLYQEPDKRNYQKAFEWAKVAAEAGMADGEYILANLYLFGRGCQADVNKAKLYYNRAASHGSIIAKQMLEIVEQGE